MKKLPENFDSWNQFHDTIIKLFPLDDITDEFQIALKQWPVGSMDMCDPEWCKLNSEYLMLFGELKALCFDELKDYRFTNDELGILRAMVDAYRYRQNPEVVVEIEDKIFNLKKLRL